METSLILVDILPEMGGVWNHFDQAIRWLLGKMTDNKGNSCWLENAIQYTNYPFGSKFEYAPLFNNSIRVNRFQFAHKEKWCCYYLYHRKCIGFRANGPFDFVAKQICCLYGHPGQSG